MNLWNFVSASNICELKRKVEVQKKHLLNLNKVKPAIDTHPPWIKTNNLDISKRNNKFEQQRNADIYNGNKILLNKMMSLEKKQLLKSKKTNSSSNRYLMSATKMHEFKKINHENKHLLKRLQSANSTYKKENWLKDIKKNEVYMNILEKRTKDKNYDYNELVVKTLSEFPVLPGASSHKSLRKENQKPSKTNLDVDDRPTSFRPSTAPKIGVYEQKI